MFLKLDRIVSKVVILIYDVQCTLNVFVRLCEMYYFNHQIDPSIFQPYDLDLEHTIKYTCVWQSLENFTSLECFIWLTFTTVKPAIAVTLI